MCSSTAFILLTEIVIPPAEPRTLPTNRAGSASMCIFLGVKEEEGRREEEDVEVKVWAELEGD